MRTSVARLWPLLLLAACRGVTAHQVADQFARDFRGARLRLPAKEDLHPGRDASGDMWGTVQLARSYLDEHAGSAGSDSSMRERYVRGLLACALIMRGQTTEARDVMRSIRPRWETRLTHEYQVVNAAVHAVAACRAVQARAAFGEVLDRQLSVEDFLGTFATFVGIELPDPGTPDYEKMLHNHAKRLRSTCFEEVRGDPREMEEVGARRTDLHRVVGEQFYNDLTALMNALPDAESAETEWLRFLAVSGFVTLGLLYNEIVPMSLSPKQKQWQLEQSDGLFMRAKRTAAKLTGRPIYMRLPDRIHLTETEIRGWIETR